GIAELDEEALDLGDLRLAGAFPCPAAEVAVSAGDLLLGREGAGAALQLVDLRWLHVGFEHAGAADRILVAATAGDFEPVGGFRLVLADAEALFVEHGEVV